MLNFPTLPIWVPLQGHETSLPTKASWPLPKGFVSFATPRYTALALIPLKDNNEFSLLLLLLSDIFCPGLGRLNLIKRYVDEIERFRNQEVE